MFYLNKFINSKKAKAKNIYIERIKQYELHNVSQYLYERNKLSLKLEVDNKKLNKDLEERNTHIISLDKSVVEQVNERLDHIYKQDREIEYLKDIIKKQTSEIEEINKHNKKIQKIVSKNEIVMKKQTREILERNRHIEVQDNQIKKLKNPFQRVLDRFRK